MQVSRSVAPFHIDKAAFRQPRFRLGAALVLISTALPWVQAAVGSAGVHMSVWVGFALALGGLVAIAAGCFLMADAPAFEDTERAAWVSARLRRVPLFFALSFVFGYAVFLVSPSGEVSPTVLLIWIANLVCRALFYAVLLLALRVLVEGVAPRTARRIAGAAIAAVVIDVLIKVGGITVPDFMESWSTAWLMADRYGDPKSFKWALWQGWIWLKVALAWAPPVGVVALVVLTQLSPSAGEGTVGAER